MINLKKTLQRKIDALQAEQDSHVNEEGEVAELCCCDNDYWLGWGMGHSAGKRNIIQTILDCIDDNGNINATLLLETINE